MLSLSQCVQSAVSSVPSYLFLALADCKVTHQCTLLALFVLGSVLLLFQVIDVQSKHLDLSPDISSQDIMWIIILFLCCIAHNKMWPVLLQF